jgi:predicted transposase YbfD/YdcC
LLDRIDITGAIITADALHTQHRHADYLIGRGAHYVLTVKRSQPSLHRQLAALPWAQIPTVEHTHDKGHGRIQSRSLKLADVPPALPSRTPARPPRYPAHPPTPIADQRQVEHETIYAITDMTWEQFRADHIAETIRKHWGIEVRREVALCE